MQSSPRYPDSPVNRTKKLFCPENEEVRITRSPDNEFSVGVLVNRTVRLTRTESIYIFINYIFSDEIDSRNDYKTENGESSSFKSNADILKDYAENATIQGLIYIFFPNQTHFGKLFWAVVVLLLLALGFYWCVTVYLNWTANPVLTTITTTAYSVKKVSSM